MISNDCPPPLPAKDHSPTTRLNSRSPGPFIAPCLDNMPEYEESLHKESFPHHPNNNDSSTTTSRSSPRLSVPRKLWSIMTSRLRNTYTSTDTEEDEGLLGYEEYSPDTFRQRNNAANLWTYRSGWSQLEYKFLAALICVLTFSSAAFLALARFATNRTSDPLANWGKPGTTSEGLSWYPTNFLRDIIPIPCHSHNDYWRKVPLFSALYAGCISTEADVWDFGGQHLFVGHNNAALTANRTFLSLYIDPLVQILENQNPNTTFYNGSSHGVFDTDHEQSLTLLVDLKTDGATTWPRVLEQLESLRERGWLSFVENGVLNRRPVTVVGTGETPFDVLTANATYRDAFFDAPLGTFWKDPAGTKSGPDLASASEDAAPFARRQLKSSGQGNAGTSMTDDFNPTNSYYASASFFDLIGVPWRFGKLSDKQLYKLRGHIAGAHEKGLKVRLWDTPAWPRSLREGIWRLLVDEGVDILNVDDLERAKSGLW